MVFLTPFFLLGLLAAAIPIGIHLIRREKPPKVMFSTIRFLKKTSKKLVLFQQLQQILLLLLRSAVIVLLVIAFARPLINASVARLVNADPQSAVIMLDLSMSMHYDETFERAREAALNVLADRNGGDEVAFIGFSESPELVREMGSDLAAVRDTIAGLAAPGYAATRFLPALQLADQMLEASQFDNRAIYMVSDFQALGLESGDEAWKLAPGVAFTGIDVGDSQSRNLVLTDVRSPEQLLEDATEQQILARVRSTGTLYQDQGAVSLIVDGEERDRQAVDLGERSEEVVTFTTEFDAEGSYVGEVRLRGDDFLLDNSYYFTVDVLPKIQVLLVNGEASENWFDDEGHWFGLAVSGTANSPFELQSMEPEELSAASLRRNDVAVLLNVGDLSESQAAAVVDYVNGGGALLIAPGDRVEADLINRQLAAILPATLQGRGDLGFDDYLVIADFDRRHPILRPLDSDWMARFQGHWSLQPVDGSSVLMQFDNSEPALVEKQTGSGQVLLFASAMDLEWNNLALQGMFLPFIHETLRHLVQPESKQRAYQVGDRINLDSSAGQSFQVTDSDGNTQLISADNPLLTAARPGLLTVESDGEETVYAINYLPQESDLNRVAVATLYDQVINPETSPVRSREVQTAQLIRDLEQPQRLWWWILLAVAALLLAELLIANRTYR
mgnify:CR=1 FL=1